MSEEKLTPSTEEVKKRGSYPSKDLKTVIDFVGKVYSQLGHTAFHSNKAIALVHGLEPASIKAHLSSGQQYKLLELKHGVGYKPTDHFQKIFLPRNDGEKRIAIIESLKTPEVYQQLFKDYEYHVVPSEGVRNHFIRTYGFKEDAATKAAQVFIDNLKDFQLLDNRGVLTSALPVKSIVTDEQEESFTETATSAPEQNGSELPVPARNPSKVIFQTEVEAQGKKTIPIYLTGNEQAIFVYPDTITEDDIELVRHQIDGVLLRIKLEAKKKVKEETSSN